MDLGKLKRRLLRELTGKISVTIECTTQCNSRCKYCARLQMIQDGELTIQDMPLNLMKNLLDQMKSLPVNVIVFAGLGEPTLYPHLREAIEYAARHHPEATTTVITNGIKLDTDLGLSLIDSGLKRLNISLNSFEPELYKELNGVDTYKIVKENAENFLELKGDKLPETRIQILEIDANKPYRQAFIDHWTPRLNHNDRLTFQVFENAGGKIDAGAYDHTARTLPERRPCIQPWRQFTVTADGDIYPCCLAQIGGPSLLLGNIKETPLKQLLNGLKLQYIKQAHLHNQLEGLPVCQTCNLWRKSATQFYKIGERWI